MKQDEYNIRCTHYIAQVPMTDRQKLKMYKKEKKKKLAKMLLAANDYLDRLLENKPKWEPSEDDYRVKYDVTFEDVTFKTLEEVTEELAELKQWIENAFTRLEDTIHTTKGRSQVRAISIALQQEYITQFK